jgi:hypothetical protein
MQFLWVVWNECFICTMSPHWGRPPPPNHVVLDIAVAIRVGDCYSSHIQGHKTRLYKGHHQNEHVVVIMHDEPGEAGPQHLLESHLNFLITECLPATFDFLDKAVVVLAFPHPEFEASNDHLLQKPASITCHAH